ncbi:MAG TPA: alpha/beta hydrolase [Candidatus Omnitrophota bacterium]|nr:alpha/beta hydrolase [Candidatus Omnitrophota bacterium]
MRLAFLFLMIGALFLALRFLEIRALYFPLKTLQEDPSSHGLLFENIFFETADHYKLNGWFIPAAGAQETILFCHGNAGNISHRIEKLVLFHQLELNVFIFDYRSYGKSQGRPSEQGLYRDVDAAYRYLISRGILPEHIIGYGESLGGAVITDLALRAPMKVLILESTFTDIRGMIAAHYPFIPHQIVRSKYDSKQKIVSIKIPKLIMHSPDDEIVPFALGKDLYESAGSPKEFLEIKGGHNDGFYQSEQLIKERLAVFLKSL